MLEYLTYKKVSPKETRFSTEVGRSISSNVIAMSYRFPFTVKDTSEATLDSKFLMIASDMGAAKAKAMRSDGAGFDVDDFVAKLVTYMGGRMGARAGSEPFDEDDDNDDVDGQLLNWEKIGLLSMRKSRRVPVIDFM